MSEEEGQEAPHSRQTRHRGLRRESRGNGAIGRGEAARGATGTARFPSRLRHVVSRYSPEADRAAFPDRGARQHDRDAHFQPAAPGGPTRWTLRSREQHAGNEQAAAGAFGGNTPTSGREHVAASAPGGGAPVVRLRVSNRLQGLETPPIGQLLRSQQPPQPTEPSLAYAPTVQLNPACCSQHACMHHLLCMDKTHL